MSDHEAAPRSTGSVLQAMVVRHGPGRPSVDHAARLLGLMGARVVPTDSMHGLQLVHSTADDGAVFGRDSAWDVASDWAESGAMWLTGAPGGPPLVAPGAPACAARGAALAIEALTAADPVLQTVAVDGAQLLGERAALSGLRRRGSTSPGGSCRLVPAADAILAVNLPRRSDVELVSPWLQVDASEDPWGSVVANCAGRAAADLVARAQMIGLPVALVTEPGELSRDEQSHARHQSFPLEPWRVAGACAGPGHGSPGTVVDLSSMWAGPLCANLLGLAGFQVVKVESVTRPDGARLGPRLFYDLLHAGHRSVTFDFSDATDLARLRTLMASADVVVESSRPRALDQLGLGPDVVLGRSPSVVWVSITGYGRSGPWNNRVAFGDDAAAGAGLVARTQDGSTYFCGDALADPLTGLHAAFAALAIWWAGSGALVDVPLRDVAASTHVGLPNPGRRGDVSADRVARRVGRDAWVLDTEDGPVPVVEPRSRPDPGRAAPMGAHNEVLG